LISTGGDALLDLARMSLSFLEGIVDGQLQVPYATFASVIENASIIFSQLSPGETAKILLNAEAAIPIFNATHLDQVTWCSQSRCGSPAW
jgi:hypothetical protein